MSFGFHIRPKRYIFIYLLKIIVIRVSESSSLADSVVACDFNQRSLTTVRFYRLWLNRC